MKRIDEFSSLVASDVPVDQVDQLGANAPKMRHSGLNRGVIAGRQSRVRASIVVTVGVTAFLYAGVPQECGSGADSGDNNNSTTEEVERAGLLQDIYDRTDPLGNDLTHYEGWRVMQKNDAQRLCRTNTRWEMVGWSPDNNGDLDVDGVKMRFLMKGKTDSEDVVLVINGSEVRDPHDVSDAIDLVTTASFVITADRGADLGIAEPAGPKLDADVDNE